jgi:hypothetical protein
MGGRNRLITTDTIRDATDACPVPMSLRVYMADKGPLWARMIEKYKLKPIPYDYLVSWGFGDFIFHSAFDNIASTIKARQHGFHARIDTEDMFTNNLVDITHGFTFYSLLCVSLASFDTCATRQEGSTVQTLGSPARQ